MQQCALILSETLALYKSFTYLLTYLLTKSKAQWTLAVKEWYSTTTSKTPITVLFIQTKL